VASPDAITETLSALADPTRRRVVELLRREPRRSSELADALETSRPAMSRHLKVLRRCGLVSERALDADHRTRVYRLEPEPFAALRQWVSEIEDFWGDQLDAFVAHAEASKR
jgi:DNA-binding transcriptional ArsR family regulator